MKILVAMSGGVDSSAAAKLLTDQGHECIGCTLKLYRNEDAGIPRGNVCCSLEDVEDARDVAFQLRIPYYVLNFSEDFKARVIEPFVSAYLNGITPNPCIECNRCMKFDALYRRARMLGCDGLASGHYARIERDGDGRYLLKKALDETKDQSYVLYNLTQEQLAHTFFPLGNLRKSETRKIAAEGGLTNAQKPDSQDICFVPDGNYARVIELNLGRTVEPGNFVDSSGRVLGRHKGIIRYTIGQHKGLDLSLPERYYVVKLSPETNTVTLGPEAELYQQSLTAGDFHWISGVVPDAALRVKAKIRYRQPEQWATVEAEDAHHVRLVFDEPQRAITPGQAVVLYDGDTVLGGGVIERGENK